MLRPPAAAALCLITGLLLTATACTHEASNAFSVTITQGSCGGSWSADGGTRTFQVTNRDIQTTEVQLVDPASGGVYAEVEALAPNATRPMQVKLGQGTYAFRCFPEDNEAVTGPAVKVSSGTGSPAVLPVSSLDLAGAIKSYGAYVTAGLTTLAGKVAVLNSVVSGGNRAQAKAAWLDAHLAYNRLGAAYDSFGDFADAIDGVPDGLPGGVHDPDFAGLHRIEYGLWHGEPMPSLAKITKQLITDVAGLRADWPKEQIDPNDLPLRAHEIIENTLQFQLTGAADEGSGTTLATALANVDGTQAVLDAIAPVMSTRYVGWPNVATWMATTRTALATAHRPDGSWMPVGALPAADRLRIDAAVGGLLEALAPIAAIGDVRRTQ